MTYCYCCIYGHMQEVGVYKCILDPDNEKDTSDVNSCWEYTFDDCFVETPGDVKIYGKCYLKDICVCRNCEMFND
jgi:hypothetical protein